MNTKQCPKCKNELPNEAVFCPYCMTKLIDVKTGETIKVKKKKFVLPIVAVSVLVLIVLVVCFIFAGNRSKTNDTQPTSIVAASSKTDYSAYIGLWSYNDENLLEIISVKEDVVRFTFTKTSSAPYNRIARISNVTTQIIDGTGTFTFDDDNWQNSGTGKIKFQDDEIYLETNVTHRNENALWDIGGSFYLVKSNNSLTDFKNYNYLGSDFDEIKRYFGEETQEADTAMENIDVHYYHGIRVHVSKSTNQVIYIYVDYSGVPMSKSNLCYGEINGNSTYDDVYSFLDEPTYNNISDSFVTYITEYGTLIFYFDDNMNVKSFSLETQN